MGEDHCVDDPYSGKIDQALGYDWLHQGAGKFSPMNLGRGLCMSSER